MSTETKVRQRRGLFASSSSIKTQKKTQKKDCNKDVNDNDSSPLYQQHREGQQQQRFEFVKTKKSRRTKNKNFRQGNRRQRSCPDEVVERKSEGKEVDDKEVEDEIVRRKKEIQGEEVNTKIKKSTGE